MTIAYIAGPMRGYDEYNFRAFHAADDWLNHHVDWVIFNPAQMDINEGFDPKREEVSTKRLQRWMRRDLNLITHCDNIVLLPGWEKSDGVRKELTVAKACGVDPWLFEPEADDGAGVITARSWSAIERLWNEANPEEAEPKFKVVHNKHVPPGQAYLINEDWLTHPVFKQAGVVRLPEDAQEPNPYITSWDRAMDEWAEAIKRSEERILRTLEHPLWNTETEPEPEPDPYSELLTETLKKYGERMASWIDDATTPMSSAEVRTVSDSGGEKGVKPEAFDLLPWEALEDVARVYRFGADKYEDHNWRKGYEWSKSFAAAMRHLSAFWQGENMDPESGQPHLAHAAFHILTLLVFSGIPIYDRHDDRYRGI